MSNMTDRSESGLSESDGRKLTPSIIPPLFALSVAVGIGVVTSGILVVYTSSETQILRTILGIITVLCLIVAANRLATIIILRNTSYLLDEDLLRKQFRLMYRKSEREIPIHQLRGVELNRGRFQTLLGYGTIVFLTAGPNRSLGFVEFQHIQDPEQFRDEVRSLLRSKEE